MIDKQEIAFVRSDMVADMPPPASEVGIVGWARKNLFSSTSNTILTLMAAYLVYLVVPGVLNWSVFNAVWSGEDRAACTTLVQGGVLYDGWNAACWPYIFSYFKLFIYGRYPADELWRVNLVLVLFFAGLIPMVMPSVPYKRENIIFMLAIFPVVSLVLLSGGNITLDGFLLPETIMAPSALKFWIDYILLSLILMGLVWVYMRATATDPRSALYMTAGIMGILAIVLFAVSFDFGLRPVETALWGGFVMTLVIAITGIVVSLPLGILLALGRRSQMPTVKLFSVIYIEF